MSYARVFEREHTACRRRAVIVLEVLMNTTFGRKVDFEYAKEFVRAAWPDTQNSSVFMILFSYLAKVQRDFLTYGTVSTWASNML